MSKAHVFHGRRIETSAIAGKRSRSKFPFALAFVALAGISPGLFGCAERVASSGISEITGGVEGDPGKSEFPSPRDGVSLYGTVVSNQGLPLQKHETGLLTGDGKILGSVKSDERGFIEFNKVPPGTHYLRIPIEIGGRNQWVFREYEVFDFPAFQTFGSITIGTGSLSGQFHFSGDGEPIDPSRLDAVIVQDDVHPCVAKASVDGSGIFRFEEIPVGDYRIRLCYERFLIYEDRWRLISVIQGEVSRFECRLPPFARLETVVVGSFAKEPLPFAEVVVRRLSDYRGEVEFTGENGVAIFPFLPPGNYRVRVLAICDGRASGGYEEIEIDERGSPRSIRFELDFT